MYETTTQLISNGWGQIYHREIGIILQDYWWLTKDEDNVLLLLSSISISFGQFKDTFICGKEGIIHLGEVHALLRSKKLSKIKGLRFEACIYVLS